MSQLRVIVQGELSPAGKKWLGMMEEESVLEVHAATDQAAIFEDFEKVGEVPVVILENLGNVRAEILSLRKSGYPHYIVWFGANFSKEDYEFALVNRVYAVLERPEIDDEKILSMFSRLAFNTSRSSHFSNLVQGLKNILVQLHASEIDHPLTAELKAATVKLQDLEAQNEFSYPGGKESRLESPLLAKSQEDLGDAIESMEDLERTGALWIKGESEDQEGRIEFLQGKIVFAETGGATGLKAIYRMFLWSNPKFLFAREMANEVPFAEESIKYPVGMVAQGRRYKLDYDTIKDELPPLEIRLEINASSVVDNLELNPRDFNVLASVVEFGRVSEVVDYNLMADSDVFQSLINLRKSNLIRVAAG